MAKAALVVLADTGSREGMGRIANALVTAQEFDEAGDEVTIVFDGAGTKWIPELANAEHKYHGRFEALKPRVAGACAYCARAFGVSNEVEAAKVALLDEYDQHPSLRRLVADGYHVITF
jgi:hypothetical protein